MISRVSGCLCGVAALLSVSAVADTVTFFGDNVGQTDIPMLLDSVGIGATNFASESVAEWYVVPGAPGEMVAVRFRFIWDRPNPIVGELFFSFGFYLLDSVSANPSADRLAHAIEALSAQNATLVFDDREVDPPSVSQEYIFPAGTRLGFFSIPNNQLDAFRADPGSFYEDPNGQGSNDELGRTRSPLFSRASANPGGFDQMLAFAANGATLFAFEDIARTSPFSPMEFNTLVFQVEVLREDIQNPDIVLPPRIDPAGERPTSIASGFFNSDGFPDIAITDAGTNSVLVYRNLGLNSVPRGLAGDDWLGFSTPDSLPAGDDPSDVKAEDIDDDGITDLLVAQRGGGDLVFLRGAGGGSFSPPATIPLGFGQDDVQPGDLDNTKDLGRGVGKFRDLVFASASQGIVGFLEGAVGTYLPPVALVVGGTPTQVALADLDGDGLGDLIWVDPSFGAVSVLLQRSDIPERFDLNDRLDFPVGPEPVSEPVAFVLEDLDGDGRLDIATVERQTSTVTVLINQGIPRGWGGFFLSDIIQVGAQPVAIGAARFFGGTLPDLVTADAASDTVAFLRNIGSGLFDDPVAAPMTTGPIDLTTADFNGDGLPDLACVGAPPSMPGMLWTLLGVLPQTPPCPGDVNGDGKVDFHDLMRVLDAFGDQGANIPEDLNSDGVVDFTDLNRVLTNFGAICD